MKNFKRIALILMATLICVFSSVVFTGCNDDDICKLYVFADKGGSVQVDGNDDLVKNGDEGSKYFTYKEGSCVKLKAIADAGYKFVEWLYIDNIDGQNINRNSDEIQFILNEDRFTIRANFEVDGSILYNVTYPTSTTGYDIVLENGYTPNVVLGGDFKFKVNLWQDYSNSVITVKANGREISFSRSTPLLQ